MICEKEKKYFLSEDQDIRLFQLFSVSKLCGFMCQIFAFSLPDDIFSQNICICIDAMHTSIMYLWEAIKKQIN